jgi:C-terminal processing protease CtpA/Prc
LYQYNFINRQETQLTNGRQDDVSPLFSPDGKTLAFVRNDQELRIIDIASKKETLLAKGYLSRPPFPADGSITWSPDNKWMAYLSAGAKNFTNVYVVSATGGDAKPVSFLANSFSGSVNWGADNFILFNTRQRTENGYIARIDLTPQLPRFREDQIRDMFYDPAVKPVDPVKPATEKTNPATDTMFKATGKDTKPSSKMAQINFENIRQRLSLLPVGVDVNDQVISKDGKMLLISASPAGQQNLYTYSLDELSKEPAVLKQLTSTSGGKSDMQFSADGKEVYYLEQGRIQSINVESRQAKGISVTAELDVDFAKEKLEIFNEAWEGQNKGFYDPKFHGVDWNAIKKEYEPFAAGASTPDELRRILNLMVGELNASHSGISGPGGGGGPTTGRIGLRFDRVAYENDGKFKIVEVVDLGPTSITGQINVGDFLTAIDGVQLTATSNLDQILENKINRKVDLTVAPGGNLADQKTVAIRPTNAATEKGLLYKQWVKQRRDYVAKISNGRLGYVHMFDMGQGSLDQFHIDLDEENHSKDGVVVDVRNNNGGFVNAYALDVLSRKSYLTMTNRGMPAAPARSQLGQRSLESPTILVTNQHSLSDAEDFTEGYRSMKLGKVVGEPTSGWIVFTSSMQLIDGTNMRMPFIKITDNEGKNMELAPRPVDVFVSNPIGESYTKTDSQLDVAVKELIKQIDLKKN